MLSPNQLPPCLARPRESPSPMVSFLVMIISRIPENPHLKLVLNILLALDAARDLPAEPAAELVGARTCPTVVRPELGEMGVAVLKGGRADASEQDPVDERRRFGRQRESVELGPADEKRMV
jgi:hypothetical protein